MPFPSPALAAPALKPYQMQFRGVTFGGVVPGSAFQLQRLDPKALGPPDLPAADAQRALDQGEFAGLDILPGRDILVDLIVASTAATGGPSNLVPNPSAEYGVSAITTVNCEVAQSAIYAEYGSHSFQLTMGGFNRVVNGAFPTDVSSWNSVSNVWTNAGAVLSFHPGNPRSGTGCMQVVTDGITQLEGPTQPMTGFTFLSGVAYAVPLWLRGNAGGEQVQVGIGLGGNNASAVFTLTTSWQRFVLPWTPASNTSSAILGIASIGTAAHTFFMDDVWASLGTDNSTMSVRHSTQRFTVTGGTSYSVASSFLADPSSPPRTTRIYLDWYDSGGARIQAVPDNAELPDNLVSWTRRAFTNVTAPANAVTAQLISEVGNGPLGGCLIGQDIHYVDGQTAVQLYTAPTTYFDGDSTGYSWAGTPGQSSSIPNAAVTLDTQRQALGAIMNVSGGTEFPLYLQLPSGCFACMARPKKYNPPPIDVSALVGGGGVANLMFHATDPRWYAAPSKTASVGLPAPLGGLTFNVTFPASFGGGGVGGLLNVTNAGPFEMRPVFVITGPCVNPRITNLSITGAPYLQFNLTLAAGDTLVVDTDFQTAVYTPAGSTIGSSRRNTRAPGSTWFNLQPSGVNQIEFNTADGTQVAGTLTVQSADAWLSV